MESPRSARAPRIHGSSHAPNPTPIGRPGPPPPHRPRRARTARAGRGASEGGLLGVIAGRSWQRIEMVLQDDGGGGRVELALARAPVALAQRQPALGLPAAQTLVLETHRHARPLLQAARKR